MNDRGVNKAAMKKQKSYNNESFNTHQGGTAQQQDIKDDPHPQQ